MYFYKRALMDAIRSDLVKMDLKIIKMQFSLFFATSFYLYLVHLKGFSKILILRCWKKICKYTKVISQLWTFIQLYHSWYHQTCLIHTISPKSWATSTASISALRWSQTKIKYARTIYSFWKCDFWGFRQLCSHYSTINLSRKLSGFQDFRQYPVCTTLPLMHLMSVSVGSSRLKPCALAQCFSRDNQRESIHYMARVFFNRNN